MFPSNSRFIYFSNSESVSSKPSISSSEGVVDSSLDSFTSKSSELLAPGVHPAPPSAFSSGPSSWDERDQSLTFAASVSDNVSENDDRSATSSVSSYTTDASSIQAPLDHPSVSSVDSDNQSQTR